MLTRFHQRLLHRKVRARMTFRRTLATLACGLLLLLTLIPALLYLSVVASREVSRGTTYPWAKHVAARKQWLTAMGKQLPPSTALPITHYLAKVQALTQPVQLKYPVVWCGAIFSKSGYGTEALSYITSLLQMVSQSDLWVAQSGDHLHDEVVRAMEPGLRDVLYSHDFNNITQHLPTKEASRPLIVVCHNFPDCWRTPADDYPGLTLKKVGKAISHFFKYTLLRQKHEDSGCPCPNNDMAEQVVYRVGRTMFETEHLPAPLAAYAQYMDEVWVPSEFGRLSFAQSGIDLTKLHVLPQGINTSLFQPIPKPDPHMDLTRGVVVAGRPLAAGARRPYRFLSVFKWEARKGWDILLPAYVDEFRQEPDVELHILTKPTFEKVTDFFSYFRSHVGPLLGITKASEWDSLPRVVLHTHYIPEQDYPQLYASMDSLVIPTRGEGWGRPQIEAMSMGLPVISTNWSGLTAFMTPETSYLIKVKDIVLVNDTGPNSFEWFQGQRWAEPDSAHLRRLMRLVFTDREAARKVGQAARRHIQEHFSELAVAQQLLAQILRIQDIVDELMWKDGATDYIDHG